MVVLVVEVTMMVVLAVEVTVLVVQLAEVTVMVVQAAAVIVGERTLRSSNCRKHRIAHMKSCASRRAKLATLA